MIVIAQLWWRGCLLIALILGCTLFLISQQPQRTDQSGAVATFKSTVNRVIVDVVVTDQNGKPVRGLPKRDFSVSEDGKGQTILSFDVHNLDPAPNPVYNLPPLPPNTFVNIPITQERGPLYVLLLDLVNTDLSDQAFARQHLLKFIRRKPAGTRFAVFVLSDGLHLVQGFTADQNQLFAAVDPSSPKAHIPRLFLFGANFGARDPLLITTALKDIAGYLDGLPGRKNLLWLSGSFPIDLFPAESDPHSDLREEGLRMLDLLARSETSVFPVNVRGVVTNPEGALTGGSPQGGAQTVTLPPGTVSNNTGPSDVAMSMRKAGKGRSLTVDDAVENEVASITGGHAVLSDNDLAGALDQATEMGANYYTLTYSPSNTNYDGKLRNIRVDLAERGYRLDYRRAYYATSPQSPIFPLPAMTPGVPPGRPVGDSLSANMQHGAPAARQVIFRAHVQPVGPPTLGTPEQMANLAQQPAYFRLRKKNRAPKPLAPIQLQTYLIEYTIIGRYPKFEVAAGVYDEDARVLNGDVEETSSAAPESSAAAKGGTYYNAQQRIDVPLKAVSMRLAVRDTSTDRIGSMEFNLPLTPEPEQASSPTANIGATPATKPN